MSEQTQAEDIMHRFELVSDANLTLADWQWLTRTMAEALRDRRLAGWEECREACKAIADGFKAKQEWYEDFRVGAEYSRDAISDAIAALTPPTKEGT